MEISGIGDAKCFSFLERETGVEPATSSLGSWHSTTELLPPVGFSAICLTPNRLRS